MMTAGEWARVLESSKPPEFIGPRPFAVFLGDTGHPDRAVFDAQACARKLGPTAHIRTRDIWDDTWGWVGYKYEVYP